MFDFLSIKALTRAGELMTTTVAGPSFREKIPPYFRAHSVNLRRGRLVDLRVRKFEDCVYLKWAPLLGSWYKLPMRGRVAGPML